MIHLTRHATTRLQERLRCSPGKVRKLAEKAWKSEETSKLLRYELRNKGPEDGIEYRAFLGYVWVFKATEKGPLLITAYNGKTDLDWLALKNKLLVEKGRLG